MSAAVIVGTLVAAGTWMVLNRGGVRTVIGFVLLGHAANVVLVVAATGDGRDVPIAGAPGVPADPLPQAFALTAIVISFGVTAFLLSLASRRADDESDQTIDDETGLSPARETSEPANDA